MDEPLSNLDAKLRVEMRAEIARLQRDLGVTTLYVTHDQVEAMTMGTRVAVLDKGRLQQIDTPQRIYDEPVNLFVATFIGSPAMNLLPGTVVEDEGGADGAVTVQVGRQRLPVDDVLLAAHPSLPSRVGQRVVVGVRPEALDDAGLEPGVDSDRVVEATVDLVESLGAELIVHVAVALGEEGPPGGPAAVGVAEEVARGVSSDDASDAVWQGVVGRRGRVVARLSTRSKLQSGDAVKLTVDPIGLHFFDPETGATLRVPQGSPE
jgi:multiple sugar transport system ATP-binding protein